MVEVFDVLVVEVAAVEALVEGVGSLMLTDVGGGVLASGLTLSLSAAVVFGSWVAALEVLHLSTFR